MGCQWTVVACCFCWQHVESCIYFILCLNRAQLIVQSCPGYQFYHQHFPHQSIKRDPKACEERRVTSSYQSYSLLVDVRRHGERAWQLLQKVVFVLSLDYGWTGTVKSWSFVSAMHGVQQIQRSFCFLSIQRWFQMALVGVAALRMLAGFERSCGC